MLIISKFILFPKIFKLKKNNNINQMKEKKYIKSKLKFKKHVKLI